MTKTQRDKAYPHRGKYVAIVNKEVFVGDSFEGAERQAKAKYLQRDPHVEFIPLKPRVMVL